MKVSVITVNRNNREGLRKTIESVASQTVRPHEFIIIDGASTDGSSDLLKERSGVIDFGVSEQDAGIYNAMNKGVRAATGDWCLFLNSGDTFHGSDVLAKVNESGTDADIICGNAVILEDTPRLKAAPAEITLRHLYGSALCHQAVFIRTELLRRRPYDESLKIVADRKFFLQSLILDSCTYKAVDIGICDYDISGFSARNRFQSEQEWRSVLRELIPERILIDYGREAEGSLYGTGYYERMFLEIGRRRWKRPVYRLVRSLLSIASIIVPGARFVKEYPKKLD